MRKTNTDKQFHKLQQMTSRRPAQGYFKLCDYGNLTHAAQLTQNLADFMSKFHEVSEEHAKHLEFSNSIVQIT